MLHRLVYTSEAARPLDPAAIETILARARAANGRRDITGALIFDSACFLQVLEGDAGPLNELYATLMRDPRHHRLRLLAYESIDERSFDRWSMAFAPADERTGRVLRRFSGQGRLAPGSLTAAGAVGILREIATMTPSTVFG